MMFALTLIVLGTLNEDDEVRTVAVMVVVVGQVTLGFCTVTLFRLARRAREEYDAAIAPVLKAAGIED